MHFTYKISLKPFPGLRVKTFSLLFLLAFVGFGKLTAQISDDFSDGDFTANPQWTGRSADFIVNPAFQLQLNSIAAGTSWLSTGLTVSAREDVEWEFLVKQTFSPSGANFGRIYLLSDQADLTQPLNGHYLQFGEAGSGDAVELFRQTGAIRESVCRATAGAISTSFEVRVKVTRSLGEWQLFCDYSGGYDYVLEASGADLSHPDGSFFGVMCTYTISNATRFFFDDVTIRTSIPPDVNPPRILALEVTSPSALTLVFSEEPDPVTAEDPLHYFASPGPGHPASVEMKADARTAELLFADPFRNGHEASLSVHGVTDLAGNTIAPVMIEFPFFVPAPVSPHDVVINEIFPDPEPRVKLPAAEFVEVFNRSENPVQLDGWQFSDGVSTGTFPPALLLPGNFLIICSSQALHAFEIFGPAMALSNFPTLNNDADRLVLMDPEGNPVDSVHYADTWYNDDDKASGGWTLERIDPRNFCAEGSNWVASDDPAGGTPGIQNSVYAGKPDNSGPRLLSVTPKGADVLLVLFDEKLHHIPPAPERFGISPFVEIRSATFTDRSLAGVTLTLSEEIRPGEKYTLKVSDVYDCPGNRIQQAFAEVDFLLPEKAVAGDIVINEILFNPRTTGVDFLEVYNRSQKIVDLKDWSVRNVQTSAGKNAAIISDGNLLMAPGEYRVFTENASVLKGEYVMAQEEAFRETDLPGFNDDAGSATLIDEDGAAIDSMAYREEMHSPFIRENEGVSLERISFTLQGSEPSNWRSASSVSSFATPGYVNSNMRRDVPADDGSVVVEPEIIQTGTASGTFARINYRFDQGGFMANVKIFDHQGRVVREIARNELLGTEGFFRWEGDHDNGASTRRGYYLVWFEIFDAGGTVKTYKRRVVIY